MNRASVEIDESLLQRLPLPLARLYRQGVNARTSLIRHQAALFLWEASVKLLASTAIATYLEGPQHDEKVDAFLKEGLDRPSTGKWVGLVRELVKWHALRGDPQFDPLRRTLSLKPHQSMPGATGLYGLLQNNEALADEVVIERLFDALVAYRNGRAHGALGMAPGERYERVGRALLVAMPEILHRIDVLAGRRLIYVLDVRRAAAGNWIIEREELTGEFPRALEPLILPPEAGDRVPYSCQVYLQHCVGDGPLTLCPLHPILEYRSDEQEFLFFNGQKGHRRAFYLCYNSDLTIEHAVEEGEPRRLLKRLLRDDVDEAVYHQTAEATVEVDAEKEPAESPCRIGGYSLISSLGSGGMGIVYRAQQPMTRRQVALKVLQRPGNQEAKARFLREIEALGRVNHPHLVKVHHFGADGDQCFFAMELIEGATLAQVCDKLRDHESSPAQLDVQTWHSAVTTACNATRDSKADPPAATQPFTAQPPTERPVPPKLAQANYVRCIVELMRQVTGAVHALHESKIVHRDIKPDNIMISADGRFAKLMDLGLAQFADDTEHPLTLDGQFVGTRRYASPEQASGLSLDGRSDVYSLGATLWELLTLRPIFSGDGNVATRTFKSVILFQAPEPLSQYHPGISSDLEKVVLKCLQKMPQHRYASAADLEADLQRWLHGEPVLAEQVTWPIRLVRSCRQRARPIAIALLALSLALPGMTWMLTNRTGLPADSIEHRLPPTAPSSDSGQLAERFNFLLEDIAGATEVQILNMSFDTAMQVLLTSEDDRRRAVGDRRLSRGLLTHLDANFGEDPRTRSWCRASGDVIALIPQECSAEEYMQLIHRIADMRQRQRHAMPNMAVYLYSVTPDKNGNQAVVTGYWKETLTADDLKTGEHAFAMDDYYSFDGIKKFSQAHRITYDNELSKGKLRIGGRPETGVSQEETLQRLEAYFHQQSPNVVATMETLKTHNNAAASEHLLRKP